MTEAMPLWKAQILSRARTRGWGEPGATDRAEAELLPPCEPALQRNLDTELRGWLDRAWRLGLLSLDWCSTDDSGRPKDPVAVVAPGGKVGFTTTSDGHFLEVRPKVADADYLALMLLAAGDDDGLAPEHEAIVAHTARPDSLIELLVVGFVGATEALVRSIGLRRQHRGVEETLRARLRGTVDVPRYLTRFANGRPLDIPCRFERHEIDTLPNRTLLWALRLARGALDSIPHLEAWRDRARRLERHFEGEGVQLTPIRPGDLRGIERLPPGFAPYDRALGIARLLIRDLTPTIADGEIESVSMAVDLAGVFEDAFASLCRACFRGDKVETQEEWTLSTSTHDNINGHMRPDVVVRSGNTTLLMDTKWKSVVDRAIEPQMGSDLPNDKCAGIDTGLNLPPRLTNMRFNYGDLYQMWSYLHVCEALEPERHVVGALVYPVATLDETRVDPIEVYPTKSSPARARPLYLVPWNVHRDHFHGTGRTNLETMLKNLLGQSP